MAIKLQDILRSEDKAKAGNISTIHDLQPIYDDKIFTKADFNNLNEEEIETFLFLYTINKNLLDKTAKKLDEIEKTKFVKAVSSRDSISDEIIESVIGRIDIERSSLQHLYNGKTFSKENFNSINEDQIEMFLILYATHKNSLDVIAKEFSEAEKTKFVRDIVMSNGKSSEVIKDAAKKVESERGAHKGMSK